MTLEVKQPDEQEIQALSSDFYSIEELEERLELASAMIDTLCIANGCGIDGCAANANW